MNGDGLKASTAMNAVTDRRVACISMEHHVVDLRGNTHLKHGKTNQPMETFRNDRK